MTGVTFAIRYTEYEMAKATRVNTDCLSTARPVLTGDSRIDQALWTLSFILADVANQSRNSSNNNSCTTITEHVGHRIKMIRPPSINETNDG